MTLEARPIRDDELGDAADLLDLVFTGGRDAWLQRFDHWWARNPAWSPGMDRGWMLRDADGRAVGFMAGTPFRYLDDAGASYLGCSIGSLAVHPDCRGAGLAGRIGAAAMRHPCDFMTGTQTSIGCWRMLMSAGMRTVRDPWPERPWLLIGDPAAFARRFAPGAAARGLAAAARLLRRLAPEERFGLAVAPVSGFDRAEDRALCALTAHAPRIRPLRDARTLNWMYFESTYSRHTRLVLAVRRGGELVGYAAFKALPDSLFLLECRVRADAPAAPRALIAAGRRHAEQSGRSHLLVYPWAPHIRAALPPLLAWRAPGRMRYTHCFAINRPDVAAEELELGPWDGDSTVMDDWSAVAGPSRPAVCAD